MSEYEKQIIFDLSKKYVFETFDFKNDSPQGLIKMFQEVSSKIEKVIEEQNNALVNDSVEIFYKSN
ncbi:hypothetical protein [Clostridium tagluense]|uniref:hypothetical protein n=1 Tax=Clostridium tagluense TaxID=360422 RepID=UPI001CF5A7A7|nr:hypothetical protein [Clostridium tagluense]MCB2297760.1 hypothetical protein [Clostridium tagluense]